MKFNVFGLPKSPTPAQNPVPTDRRNEVYSVEVENATLDLGQGKHAVKVLDDVNLRLPEGNICAILGPSGCGKTTLLKCLVGLEAVKGGQIRVFGFEPGSDESGVPGPAVGYMPQVGDLVIFAASAILEEKACSTDRGPLSGRNELSLYPDITIIETLTYFGSLQLMPDNEIQQRTEFLLKLLDIPTRPGLLVKELSGGQQRRLSLASALIHDPPIVLLDEPTVGVDPLMRKSIWKHLDLLAHEQGKTVIITTHYVEEARRADLVCFMRKGKTLLTGAPDVIMRQLQCTSLDEVFLHILNKDSDEIYDQISASTSSTVTGTPEYQQYLQKQITHQDQHNIVENSQTTSNTNSQSKAGNIASPNNSVLQVNTGLKLDNLQSVTDDAILNTGDAFLNDSVLEVKPSLDCPKDLRPLERHTKTSLEPNGVTFLDEPVLDSEISRLKTDKFNFGVIVRKQPRNSTRKRGSLRTYLYLTYTLTWKNYCILKRNILLMVIMFACPVFNVLAVKIILGRPPFDVPFAVVNEEQPATKSLDFRDRLDNDTFKKTFVDNVQDAVKLIKDGKIWAAVRIKGNFTVDLRNRFASENLLDVLMVDTRNVVLYVDSTNIEIFRTIYLSVLDSYDEFLENFYFEENVNPKVFQSPLVFANPVFGAKRPHFADFTNANLLSDSMFIMSMGLAALTLISEKVNGLFDRCKVSRLTVAHVLLSHFVVNTVMAAFQTCILLTYVAIAFSITPASLALIGGFCFLTSNAGMSIGILISAIVNGPYPALLLVTAVYQVNGLACGMFWPFESQPLWIRPLTSFAPQAFTVQAIREAINKNWGLDHVVIWSAVLVGLAWTVCPLILTAMVTNWSCNGAALLRWKRKRQRNVDVKSPESSVLVT